MNIRIRIPGVPWQGRRRRHVTWVTAILLAVIALTRAGFREFFSPRSRPVDTASSERAAYLVRVRYVIDGDTFIGDDDRHYRIVGIDCPELAHHGDPEQPFAQQAKAWLKNKIQDRTVMVSHMPNQAVEDVYGRELVSVIFDNQDVAKQLLETGLARCFSPETHQSPREYLVAEKQAQAARLGIWKAYRH